MKKLLVILICLIFLMGCFPPSEPIRYKLKQISLSTTWSAFFIIAIGGGGKKLNYVFYTEDENGCIKLRQERCDYVEIYEDSKEAYALHTEKEAPGGAIIRIWEIHIPPNSIKYDINLDLRNLK